VQATAKKAISGSESLPAAAQADRAAFNARNYAATTHDLVQKVKEGKVKLEELKKEELPEEFKGKTLEEQKELIAKIDGRRQELSKQAIDLDKKRNEFITKKLAADAKSRANDSFDNQVLRILQTQARRANIQYGEEKKK